MKFLDLVKVYVRSGGGGGGSDSGGEKSPTPPANVAPTANAGIDQTVDELTEVTLSGSGTDSDGSIASYSWTQTAGSSVTLSSTDSANVSFTAPDINADETLTFKLTVTDDDGASNSDFIDIALLATTIVSEKLEVLSLETINSIVEIALDGSIVVNNSSSLAIKEVGDYIVADTSSKTPEGLLRKITAKREQDGQVILETIQPPLAEVIPKGKFSLSQKLQGDLSTSLLSNSPPGVSLYTKSQKHNATYHKVVTKLSPKSKFQKSDLLIQGNNPDIFKGCAEPEHFITSPQFVLQLKDIGVYLHKTSDISLIDNSGDYDELPLSNSYNKVMSLSGCLAFDIGLDMESSFSEKHFKLVLTPEEYGELNLNVLLANVDLSPLAKEKYKLGTLNLQPITVPVGPVPVVFIPKIDLVVGFSAEIEASVETKVTEYAGVSMGFDYTNGNVTHIVETNFDFNHAPPELSITATANAFIGPEVKVLVYGLVGPNASMNFYTSLELDALDDPWWQLTAGIRAGVGATLEVFHINWFEVAIPDLISLELLKLQAKNAPTPPTPLNVQVVASDSYNQLNWDNVIGASKYLVYWDTSPQVDENDNVITVFEPSLQHDNLTNDITYYYAISASNGTNNSPLSAEYFATPTSSALAPVYQHGNFKVTSGTYSEADNNNAACQTEFGDTYRLADWNDVVDYYNASKSMNDFFVNLGMPSLGEDGARNLHVARDGSEIYSGIRHYFITRHDHNKPGYYLSHANIDNHLIDLGSWQGTMPALCFVDGKTADDELLYFEDFSSDAGFTNNTSNVYQDADETYYAKVFDVSSGVGKDLGLSPIFSKTVNPETESFIIEFDVNPINPDWGTYPSIWFVDNQIFDLDSTTLLGRSFSFCMCWEDSRGKNFRLFPDAVGAGSSISPTLTNENIWYHVKASFSHTNQTFDIEITYLSDGSAFHSETGIQASGIGDFNRIMIGGWQNPPKYGSYGEIKFDNIAVRL